MFTKISFDHFLAQTEVFCSSPCWRFHRCAVACPFWIGDACFVVDLTKHVNRCLKGGCVMLWHIFRTCHYLTKMCLQLSRFSVRFRHGPWHATYIYIYIYTFVVYVATFVSVVCYICVTFVIHSWSFSKPRQTTRSTDSIHQLVLQRNGPASAWSSAWMLNLAKKGRLNLRNDPPNARCASRKQVARPSGPLLLVFAISSMCCGMSVLNWRCMFCGRSDQTRE